MTEPIPSRRDATAAESPSRGDGLSYPHPLWCDRQHADVWPVHSAYCGEVELADQFRIEVEITEYAGKPAVVSLIETCGDDTIVTDLTADQARELGRWLAAAADILTASS